MIRYLYLRIYNDEPVEVRHFLDRSAGLKVIVAPNGEKAAWS